MTTEERIAALERRVAALENQLGELQPQTTAEAGSGLDAERFWALEGLRARVADPGAVLISGHVVLPDGRGADWQEAAPTQDLLAADWKDHVDVLSALAHPVRLRLIQQVVAGASSVQDLLALEGIGTSGQVYHHLRQLIAAGWLRPCGSGRYEVPVARVVPLLTTMLGARR